MKLTKSQANAMVAEKVMGYTKIEWCSGGGNWKDVTDIYYRD